MSQIWVSTHVGTADMKHLQDWAVEWLRSPQYATEKHWSLVFNHTLESCQTIHIKPLALTKPARIARICEQICGHLCRELNGMIVVNQEGFFSPEGRSLLPENDTHQLKTA